jgi:hypothetical protein
MIQHPDTAAALVVVTVKREVDFLDAEPFGGCAEGRFGSACATAEQNAVVWFHESPRKSSVDCRLNHPNG